MSRLLLAATIATVVVGGVVHAHHSYSATYDINRQVTLEGKLVQFIFKNPHSFVTLQAPDDKGSMQRWSVEWSGTGQLTTQGVTRDTLRTGDEVVILGNPSRVRGEFKALMISLKRPSDGFSWGGRAGESVD